MTAAPDLAGPHIDHSVRVGIAFGLTSGVITTLGLLVGLSAGTSSRAAVLGGIFTIAVADAFSDALGIHVSEESEGIHTARQVWTATLATFLAKFLTALTFAVPVLLLSLPAAVLACVVWGAVTLTALSIDVARRQSTPALPLAAEHLGVATLVVIAAHLVGLGVAGIFG
jgi:VIT1/CCC1 family predicted Fe2+/Mn2+ transporter